MSLVRYRRVFYVPGTHTPYMVTVRDFSSIEEMAKSPYLCLEGLLNPERRNLLSIVVDLEEKTKCGCRSPNCFGSLVKVYAATSATSPLVDYSNHLGLLDEDCPVVILSQSFREYPQYLKDTTKETPKLGSPIKHRLLNRARRSTWDPIVQNFMWAPSIKATPWKRRCNRLRSHSIRGNPPIEVEYGMCEMYEAET